MTVADLIYAAAPWAALVIVAVNWRPIVWLIVWLIKTLACGVGASHGDER